MFVCLFVCQQDYLQRNYLAPNERIYMTLLPEVCLFILPFFTIHLPVKGSWACPRDSPDISHRSRQLDYSVALEQNEYHSMTREIHAPCGYTHAPYWYKYAPYEYRNAPYCYLNTLRIGIKYTLRIGIDTIRIGI